MNTVEKSIFDALASGRGVNLPGLGSLSVVRQPAGFVSGKVLRPPHNKVAFSSEQHEGYLSLSGSEYDTWFATAVRGRNVVEIGGTGVLRDGVFYPSVELFSALNPDGAEPVVLRRRPLLWRKTACAVALIAGAVIGCVIWLDGRLSGMAEDADSLLVADMQEAAITEAAASEFSEQDALLSAEESGNAGPSEEVAAEDSVPVVDEPVSERGDAVDVSEAAVVYHVVAGVFSEEANADKLIARDALGIGSANYVKVPFAGGKTLVSAFAATSQDEALARRRSLCGTSGDLWIYRQER